MDLGLRQTIRSDLQLRLSPQILQRIEVLQLPALDLSQLIEQELQENETLETEIDADKPAEETEDRYEDERDDWTRPSADAVTAMEVMEATATAPLTMRDHLMGQLDTLEIKPRERAAAAAIIEALSERGLLDLPLQDVEMPLDPPATGNEREHALHIVQALDPTGVGARDMTECLLLQLDPQDAEYDLLVSLVVQHLDDIAHNRIPRIARETGAGVERVLAAIDKISHLDPIPGRRFSGVRAPQIHPDVVIRPVGDAYEIILENDWVPSLRISPTYQRMARDRGLDPDLRKHIRAKIENAQSLIDAIEQRKNTLFRVASEIVNRQADYLSHGPSGLRPLRMQEVADALGVHVSTVSRAISGKFFQTPRGIVSMKSLFTGEVPAQKAVGGAEAQESASRASVQELVRELVAAEDRHAPLSDEAIVDVLKERHGLDIARRTVTKYRKALNIGSSRARRQFGPT